MHLCVKLTVLCFVLHWDLCWPKAQSSEWIEISWFEMALSQALIMPRANEKRYEQLLRPCPSLLCKEPRNSTIIFTHHGMDESTQARGGGWYKHQDGSLALAL